MRRADQPGKGVMGPMIQVEEAITLLTQATPIQTETETVDILSGVGRVTAEDLHSAIAVPPFAKSAMDGYALRSEDSRGASREHPVLLRVVGELCAGDARQFSAGQGTAVRIMTGGAIPAGYDCVLMQEDSDYGQDTVAIYRELAPWANYCPLGEDLLPGQLVVPTHTRLTSRHIGVLASMGIPNVKVLRPYRVGIVATGDELVPPGSPLGPAQLYNSSSYTIAAQLKTAGVEVAFLELCRDDPDAFCQLIRERMGQVDLVITTGAVSVGSKDIIPGALAQLGARRLFHGVHMKPGTPVLASEYQEKLLLGLSGNPFAALVNFQLFFWPVLATALNNPSFCWQKKEAVVQEGSMKAGGQRRFVRASLEEDGVHLYTHSHQSSVFANLLQSNCIIDQPPGQAIQPGSQVQLLYWQE